MIGSTTELEPTQFLFTVRFDQGYRYLDKCGEALIRLENTLDEGWIPGEPVPSSGQLRNATLGLAAKFNANSLDVVQAEFMSFDHFVDQTCKIYEILRCTFDIRRVLTPAFRTIYQIGFPEVEVAARFLRSLGLCHPDGALVDQMGGDEAASDFTLCTQGAIEWQGAMTERRTRIEAKVIRQERQPYFDERILLRLPLLPQRYHDAIREIRKLRRQHSKIAEVAAQFDIETTLQSEFNSGELDLDQFLRTSRDWTVAIDDFIKRRMRERCQTS